MVSFPALAELVQPLAKLTDLIAETVDFNTGWIVLVGTRVVVKVTVWACAVAADAATARATAQCLRLVLRMGPP